MLLYVFSDFCDTEKGNLGGFQRDSNEEIRGKATKIEEN